MEGKGSLQSGLFGEKIGSLKCSSCRGLKTAYVMHDLAAGKALRVLVSHKENFLISASISSPAKRFKINSTRPLELVKLIAWNSSLSSGSFMLRFHYQLNGAGKFFPLLHETIFSPTSKQSFYPRQPTRTWQRKKRQKASSTSGSGALEMCPSGWCFSSINLFCFLI